jgi:hypothetical protein
MYYLILIFIEKKNTKKAPTKKNQNHPHTNVYLLPLLKL